MNIRAGDSWFQGIGGNMRGCTSLCIIDVFFLRWWRAHRAGALVARNLGSYVTLSVYRHINRILWWKPYALSMRMLDFTT